MPFNYPRSGPNNVAEFMMSGLPWVTSSVATTTPWRIDFPYVTNDIRIHCHSAGATLRVGFTENGVNGMNGQNFLWIQSGDGYVDLTTRTKTIFVRSEVDSVSASIYAGLTLIEPQNFPVLTGSAIYNSASIQNVFGYGKPGTVASGTGLG